METKRCLIITGGTIDLEFTKEYLSSQSFECIIAVDKGMNSAYALDLKPNFVLGDFDSVDKTVLAYYTNLASEHDDLAVRRLNPMKDMTDTEDAIELALDQGVGEIVMIGATGTRLDHVLANINLLMKPLKNSVKACILDKNNRIYLYDRDFTIKKSEAFGKYLSLLPLSTEVTGVTLKGMQYPLNDYTLTIGNSLGVSNEIADEVASISLKEGILIVIESRD